jgi:DNA polymerase III delta subunit
MIYILVGNDTKKKNTYIKTLTKNSDLISVPAGDVSKDLIKNYALGMSLFENKMVVSVENIITKGEITFSDEELKILKDSKTIFFLLEDKLLVATEKKYKKYAEIVRFDEKPVTKAPKINTFAIADAYGSRDKIKAWMLYREAIESGVEPEAISGILFWKIKTMLLGNTKTFSVENLKRQSGNLVSLYHRAHRGEADFVIGLEQFILSSLSK